MGDESGAPRRPLGRWLRPVAAGLAALAAALTVVVLLSSGGDEGSPDRGAGPTASPPAEDAPTNSGGGAPGPRLLTDWPDRSGYTVVVYANETGRARARALARRAVRFGWVAGVLNSGEHPGLEPGKVVGFAGIFRSSRQARRAAARLRAQGVAVAPYVRFIAAPSR